jgi:hypothetical protein
MADVEGGVSGGLGGAAAGAAVGSVVPGIGTAVGAVAGGLLGGVAGLFGGGGSTETGLTLPPSLEFRMLNDAYTNFQRMEQDYKRTQQLTAFYEQKLNSISQQMLAGVPPDQIRSDMARQTADLAKNLGMPIGDALKNGFLSQDDIDDMKALKELESADLRDPRYEQAREQQKQQLMQNLQRQGASPQQISQALLDFENTSTIGRFEVADQMRTSRSALISNRMGMRQDSQRMWFDMGSSAINTQMGVQNSWGNQLANAGAMTQSAYQVGATGIGMNAALRGEMQNQYNQLGQYKFSKDAKGYMKSDPFSTGQFQNYGGYRSSLDAAKLNKNSQYWSHSQGRKDQFSAQSREAAAKSAAEMERETARVNKY